MTESIYLFTILIVPTNYLTNMTLKVTDISEAEIVINSRPLAALSDVEASCISGGFVYNSQVQALQYLSLLLTGKAFNVWF